MRKLLLGLIGLLFAVPAVAATLPAGYTELEYIESTGTQYIDTGVVQTDTVGIKIVIDDTSKASPQAGVAAYFIGTQTSGSYMGYFTRNNSAGWAAVWAWNGENVLGYNIQSTRSTVYINYKNDRRYVYNNGTRDYIGVSSLPTLGSGGNSLYLFAIHMRSNVPAYYGAGKIYSVELTEGTEVVRNFVPAKNSSGVVGMYDTVSGNFFTNAGTGEFIAGPEVSIRIATTAYNSARFSPVVTELNDTIATIRSVVTNTINQTKAIADLQANKQTRPNENCPAGKKCLLVEDNDGQPHWYEIIENAYGLPSGYTALEYIQSTGTQYIDTGYTPTTAGYSANIKFMLTGDTLNNQTIIGFNIVLSDVRERMSFGLNGTAQVVFGYGNGSSGYSNNGSGVIHLNRLTEIKVNFVTPASLRINGTEYFSTSTFTRANSTNVYLMKVNGAEQSSTGRWYSAQIYNQNNELVRNLVPAKNSSGVIGMYDTVSGEFFTNKGSGTFVAGPEI